MNRLFPSDTEKHRRVTAIPIQMLTGRELNRIELAERVEHSLAANELPGGKHPYLGLAHLETISVT